MSNINVMRKNLGPVTAYKYAVQQGYTGTEQEFAALMASYATVAEEAEAAKDDAIDAKTAAEEAQAAAQAAAEQAESAIEVDDTLSVEGRAADAKKTGDKLTALKGDLTQLVDDLKSAISGQTKNIFDPYSADNSWISSTGAISTAYPYFTSDYIKIESSTDYFASSGRNINAFSLSWYDTNEDEGFLSRSISEVSTVNGGDKKFFTAQSPSNAEYVRVGYYIKEIQTAGRNVVANDASTYELMLAKGSSASEYIPYLTAVDYVARDATEKSEKAVEFVESFPENTVVLTNKLNSLHFVPGMLAANSGSFSESTTRIASGFISLDNITSLFIRNSSPYENRVLFYDYKQTFINTTEEDAWHSELDYPIPSGAKYFRICIRKSDNSIINYTDNTGCAIIIDVNYKARERNNLYGKSISILGDSISTYAGVGIYAVAGSTATANGVYTYSGNGCRYPQLNLLTNVADTYWMKLIQHFGMSLKVNESWAGSVVCGSDVTAISNMARIEHLGANGNPDIILVNAGTNDVGQAKPLGVFDITSPANYTETQIRALDVSTFANAYRAMIIRLQYFYPDAIIIVLLPNYTSSYYTPDEADAYNEIIKEICDYFGVYWIDARTSGITMFNRSKYLPDGIHYNSAGMDLLYQNIRNKLELYFGA